MDWGEVARVWGGVYLDDRIWLALADRQGEEKEGYRPREKVLTM